MYHSLFESAQAGYQLLDAVKLVMYHSLFESLCMVPDPRIERKKFILLTFYC